MFCLFAKFQFDEQIRTAPKPPSDEGGAPKGRRERTTPQTASLTAPLTRGALGTVSASATNLNLTASGR